MKALTLETAGLRASRPNYSALSNATLAAGIPPLRWDEALARFLAR